MLSQPSQDVCLSILFLYINQGVIRRKCRRFYEKSSTFLCYNQRVLEFAPSLVYDNLIFLIEQSIFLLPFSRFLSDSQKKCYKIAVTHLLRVVYEENGEGCESKKCKLQGARAYAYARDLDLFFLTCSFFFSSAQPDLCRDVVQKAGIHRQLRMNTCNM